jgi:hypothetical protein
MPHQEFWHVFYLRYTAVYGYVEKGGKTEGENCITRNGDLGPLADACIVEFDFNFVSLY